MKKALLLITIFLLTLGYAQAQHVYYTGNHNGIGKIWKNDSLVQSINDTMSVHLASLQVAPDGTIYTAGRVNDSGFNFVQGRVWLNDSLIFNAGNNTTITSFILNDTTWTAAGFGENEWENAAGLVWQNGGLLYTYSDSVIFNRIYALAIDTTNGDIYSGGTSGEYEEPNAAVWKNDSLLWNDYPFAKVLALAFDGADIYAAGNQLHEDSLHWATLWQNDEIVFSIDSVDSEFSAIAIYDGSIYLGGYNGDTLYIWQDEDVLYSHPFTTTSKITTLVVNETGVYYAGQLDGNATVWKDGEILYQPEDCEEITSIAIVPYEPLPVYTITVESTNLEWGVVIGGGTFNEGDTAILIASPSIGCEFLEWNDGNTENPRHVVVTQDSTFIASFDRIAYTITVESDHPEWGNVSGGGIYYYGDTIQISAIPNIGYTFLSWDDYSTINPRTIVVTEDHTYTAYFELKQCVVTTIASPEEGGIVLGGGTYSYGDTILLVAQNNTGYIFKMWEDEVMENPRQIIVEDDVTYTAIFNPLQYEITTSTMPEEGGSVEGAGVYDYGFVATLTARPFNDYAFLCWSDGITSNPRHITVTQNAHYEAIFYFNGVPSYEVKVLANDPELGMVTGEGIYPEGTSIEISATPANNAQFVGWDDGNTDNPRTIVVTSDMIITAIFELLPTYTIIVKSDSPEMGTVYGGGTYPVNTVINIGAIPAEGYHFIGWQDEDMNNPRTITVTEDADFIAYFSSISPTTFTITVYYDNNQGFVIGAGTYNAGSVATLAAIPADNYMFVKWSDGTTDNPKEVLVDHDIELSAFFNGTGIDESGLETVKLYPNPANDKIHIEGLQGEHEINIYNATGIKAITTVLQDNGEIDIHELQAGLYLIRIDGKYTMRFIKK